MAQTLSDKIADILSAAPTSFDPEDDVHEETAARVEVDDGESVNEDDLTLGRFRKANVELLEEVDKRYEGKRASRKKLNREESELESDDDEDEHEKSEQSKDTDGDEESSNEESVDEEESQSSDGSDNNENNRGYVADNTKVFRQSESINQLGKSACVRQQLNMWESFLEMRIQLQKCLLTSNKLPQPSHFTEIQNKCTTEFSTKVEETSGHVKNLLDKFLHLQSLLLRNYPETNKILSKNVNHSDEEIPSDTDDEKQDVDGEEIPSKRMKLAEYGSELSNRFDLYHRYRNTVLQKWHDKTRIGANRSGNVVHSVTEQIRHILNSREKLIKATQLKRTDYDILGVAANDSQIDNEASSSSADNVYNVNIFDDTDFYHHLLRELIEYKSADLTDPVKLGQQWTQLQNLRSKMKKKVDTKATKGRKIRYVVHSKLVNFMAPIDDITWHEMAKNELYNSLFGKNQSSTKVTTS